MALKLAKPILLTGIGISAGFGLWDSFWHSSLMQAGELTVALLIAGGSGFWWLKHKRYQQRVSQVVPSSLDPQAVEEAIALAEKAIYSLEREAKDRDISSLKQQLAQLTQADKRQSLQLAIVGEKKVGKDSLKEILEQREIGEKLRFTETDSLELAKGSDLVLFFTAGDLTDSQWQVIQELLLYRLRVLLILNTRGRYLPEERALILQQLRQRVGDLIPAEDVLAIAASTGVVKVRQHRADGSVAELLEEEAPLVENLSTRLQAISSGEREQLVLASTWRQAVRLKEQAKQVLNEVRRHRANPLVEKYQWIAAAAAFANPVPAGDLLATAAINTQMLVDLSAIYQQKFSFSQASTGAGTIGELMVKLGLVELSTQTIGSILKTNAFSYVAGGAVQGISAAYLTRIAGLSLIEYFQEQEISIEEGKGFNLARMSASLKQVFAQNQRTAFLSSFVKQAVARLSSTSSPQTI